MKLTHDHNPGAYTVRVPCLHCGKMVVLAEAVIDLDGPAFKAYYHDTDACRPIEPKVAV